MKVVDVELWRGEIPLARVFKFGVAELDWLEHMVVRCAVDFGDGSPVEWGMAGENLVPRWFEKVPGRELEEDVERLRGVVVRTGGLARRVVAQDPAAYWRGLYDMAVAEMGEVAGLVRQLGVSLFERAVLDAWCRRHGRPLAAELGLVPVGHLRVRHTVGMGDDVGELGRILRETGIRGLKVKLSGEVERDEARLVEVMGAVRELGGVGVDRLTVDGNENYARVEELGKLLRRLRGSAALGEARGVLTWVEQALRRDVALSEEAGAVLREYAEIPQVIDESDAGLGDLERALGLGYAGTTHKNCKGVFKSVGAKERLGKEKRATILSGEDLTIVAPWSQTADLAAAAMLGVVDVERNGQHYAEGLSAFDERVQEEALRQHPELYARDAAGVVRLKVVGGEVDCSGVNAAAFGWRGTADAPARFEQVM